MFRELLLVAGVVLFGLVAAIALKGGCYYVKCYVEVQKEQSESDAKVELAKKTEQERLEKNRQHYLNLQKMRNPDSLLGQKN